MLTMLLKFHKHPQDQFGLGLEKGVSSSKAQSESNKYDFFGKFGHTKFKCIHKKKKMPKSTNVFGPKTFWVLKSHIVPIADILGWKRSGLKLVPG